MAVNPYESIIPWRLLQRYLQEQLVLADHKVRRASSDGIFVNQGRAQMLEELLNLPTALENFAEYITENSEVKEQKV